MATGRKFLTHEELAKYPKSVLLAAIERRTLMMPTQYDMEYAAWDAETKAGLADMDAADKAVQEFGPISPEANWQAFEAHRKAFTANHAAFDRAQARIDAAHKRWEKFKDA